MKILDQSGVIKNFNGLKIEMVSYENELWMNSEQLGIGLGYRDPLRSINRIYARHKSEFEEYSILLKVKADHDNGYEAQHRMARVFNEEGIFLLIIMSRMPKAKDFRDWMAVIFAEFRRKERETSESSGPMDELYTFLRGEADNGNPYAQSELTRYFGTTA